MKYAQSDKQAGFLFDDNKEGGKYFGSITS